MMKGMLTVALATLLVQVAFSQTLDEVLAKHYKARGGLKAIRAVKTITITGTLKMIGKEFSLTILHKRPNAVRTEYKLLGKSFVDAFNGTTGWQINPMTGALAPRDLEGEQLKSLKQLADMDGPLVDWKAKGYTLRLLGKEDVGGKSAYHLDVLKDTALVRQVFLDAATFQLVQEKNREQLRGQTYDIVTSFQEFKKVKGLMFPFRQIVSGGMPQEMIFQKIELDRAVPDSLFAKPVAK